jgi:hypothetical protein
MPFKEIDSLIPSVQRPLFHRNGSFHSLLNNASKPEIAPASAARPGA